MRGPKSILSESIAKALGDFFVVDPKDIETNLLSDAGVTLHDLQLKPLEGIPINSQTTLSLTGTVASVSFHWEWGQDQSHEGGSSWVKNSHFEMKGAKFIVILHHQTESSDTDPSAKQQDKSKESKAKSGMFSAYVQDEVNRIIDTLKLSISDYELSIQVPPAPGIFETRTIVFGGSDLQLDSLGRFAETDTLKQELSIGKIFSHVVYSSSAGKPRIYPLLDPISYKASCVRVGGKRFTGGFKSGLEVTGESTDDGFIVHTGERQIELLNALIGLLLAPKSKKRDEGPNRSSSSSEEEKEDMSMESELEISDMHSSFFRLPLAALSLVFPNDTKLSMAGLVVSYQMDRNIFSIEGKEGFKINEFPILSMSNEESCMWQADMVTRNFRVYDARGQEESNDGIVACVNARDGEIQNVKDGVKELLNILATVKASNSGAAAVLAAKAEKRDAILEKPTTEVEEIGEELEEQSKSPWTFNIVGGLEFLMQGPEDSIKTECLIRDVTVSMSPLSARIGVVEKFCIPNSIRLTEPLESTILNFDGTLFDLQIGNIVAKLEEPVPEDKPADDKAEILDDSSSYSMSSAESSTLSSFDDSLKKTFVLPFGGKSCIESITVYETNGKTIHTTIKTIQAAVGPDAPEASDNEAPIGGIRAVVMVDEVEHNMLSLTDAQLSAVIHPEDRSTVKEFEFDASHIAVAAGYSVFDWKRLFESGDEKRERHDRKKAKKEKKQKKRKSKKERDEQGPRQPLKIPHAHIHPLKVKVAVDGDIMGTKGTILRLKEFHGDDDTTVSDLVKVYSAILISKVPGIVTNADILSFNVADTAASSAGIAVGAGALSALGSGAAPIASVLGVVGFDGIRGTIQAGKKSRGADPDDKWKFSDLTRGLGQAATDATRDGAAKRGKSDSDKGSAVDWALGATSNVAKYSSKNKARLGGAGAGTAGFAVGMVFGGPLGAIAGAVIANATTSKTIEAVDKKLSKSKKDKQQMKQIAEAPAYG